VPTSSCFDGDETGLLHNLLEATGLRCDADRLEPAVGLWSGVEAGSAREGGCEDCGVGATAGAGVGSESCC